MLNLRDSQQLLGTTNISPSPDTATDSEHIPIQHREQQHDFGSVKKSVLGGLSIPDAAAFYSTELIRTISPIHDELNQFQQEIYQHLYQENESLYQENERVNARNDRLQQRLDEQMRENLRLKQELETERKHRITMRKEHYTVTDRQSVEIKALKAAQDILCKQRDEKAAALQRIQREVQQLNETKEHKEAEIARLKEQNVQLLRELDAKTDQLVVLTQQHLDIQTRLVEQTQIKHKPKRPRAQSAGSEYESKKRTLVKKSMGAQQEVAKHRSKSLEVIDHDRNRLKQANSVQREGRQRCQIKQVRDELVMNMHSKYSKLQRQTEEKQTALRSEFEREKAVITQQLEKWKEWQQQREQQIEAKLEETVKALMEREEKRPSNV